MLLQNFDDVLTPIDHVSRNPNDTYYVDKDTVRPPLPRCVVNLHGLSQISQNFSTPVRADLV